MIITIDTGGTKTLIAGFHKNGEPGSEHRFPTPADTKEYVDQLVTLLNKNYEAKDLTSISIAVPGTVEDGTVLWCGNLPWKNFDLAGQLGKHFKCPILVENDANLAGLSEANSMSEVPPLAVYLTISTGIGGGVIADGQLLPSLSGSEPGHMLVEYDGKLRMWESFASGRAIYETFGKHAYEIENDELWDQIAVRISRGMLSLIPMLQPDVIIIGGSMGTHLARYKNTLNKLIDKQLPANIRRPKIKQAEHPQEAVIYGCYYYAVHKLPD